MTNIQEFQQPIKVAYPPGNDEIFEQWLTHNLDHVSYLPINWCGFFVNHQYGKERMPMQRLQRFVDRLDKSKEWFTVTQYDLGILTDISGLKIKVFGSGGGRIDFPLPLICKPHGRKENTKDIFASFIGSKTHPIRNQILQTYSNHRDWVVTDLNYDINTFCDVLSRSVFALCPRGFGLTSFRICEALEQGAIPVYVSDTFIIPGNEDFESYGVLIHNSEVNQIDQILYNISEDEIISKRQIGHRRYHQMFTYEGCKNLILENI